MKLYHFIMFCGVFCFMFTITCDSIRRYDRIEMSLLAAIFILLLAIFFKIKGGE